MPRYIDAATLKTWLDDGRELALLDIREHGQFGESHLFHAAPLPFSRLELDAPRLVPRRTARVVVHDDGASEGVANAAAEALGAIGYTDVYVLQGGTAAWHAAGYGLFAGVNVPSKAFGELIEQRLHTPRLDAQALHRKQREGERLVVLDGRPLSEFAKMSIPGAVCCPNGELAYRLRDLVPDDATPIVINCAGRTRSIIGAQTLINLGVRNPIYALENGTQGWFLADLPLEHGASRRYPDKQENLAPAQTIAAAQELARRHGADVVDAATVKQWAADSERSLFLCDVRTSEEFASATLAGAQHTPGGQLIQATDQYIGVRGARLVLLDSDGVRAPVVASWLRQLGHEAFVLRDGVRSGLPLANQRVARCRANGAPLPEIDAGSVASQLASQQVAVIDLRPSMAYRREHLPGSRWSIRPRLAGDLAGEKRPIVLVADRDDIADIAALSLPPWQRNNTRRLAGGIEAWRDAGMPLVATPSEPADADCIDYLFFVHDRHDGNKEAARQYLSWETNLLAQMDEQELGTYRLP